MTKKLSTLLAARSALPGPFSLKHLALILSEAEILSYRLLSFGVQNCEITTPDKVVISNFALALNRTDLSELQSLATTLGIGPVQWQILTALAEDRTVY